MTACTFSASGASSAVSAVSAAPPDGSAEAPATSSATAVRSGFVDASSAAARAARGSSTCREVGPQLLTRVGHRLGVVGQLLAGEPEALLGGGQRPEPEQVVPYAIGMARQALEMQMGGGEDA